MCEESFRHKVVRLDHAFNIVLVNAYSNTHDHMLGTFGNTAIDPQKIRPLESLEAEAEKGSVQYHRTS